MTKYIVNPFFSININDGTLIQTNKNMLSIYNINMQKFLNDIQEKSQISNSEIEKYFKNTYDDAKKFLLKNNILSKVKNLNFNIKRLVIISDTNSLYLKTVLKKITSIHNIKIEFFNNIYEVNDSYINSLFIIYKNKYTDKEILDTLHSSINDESNIIQLILPFEFNYYIENIYNKMWGNPDHFDLIGNIETSNRNGKNITYQDILNKMFDKKKKIYSLPLQIEEKFVLEAEIIKRIKLVLLPELGKSIEPNQFLDIEKFNPKTLTFSKDTAIFYELKDDEM